MTKYPAHSTNSLLSATIGLKGASLFYLLSPTAVDHIARHDEKNQNKSQRLEEKEMLEAVAGPPHGRCGLAGSQSYIEAPPPDDWNGVVDLKQK